MVILANLTKVSEGDVGTMVAGWMLQVLALTVLGGIVGGFFEVNTQALPKLDFAYANIMVGAVHGMAIGFVATGMQFALSSLLTGVRERQASWGALSGVALFVMIDLGFTLSEAILTMEQPAMWWDAEKSTEGSTAFIGKLLLSLLAGYLVAFFAIRMKKTPDSDKEVTCEQE